EQRQDRGRAKAEAVQLLLSLADNFQAVVKHVPSELTEHSWTKGVMHVARQLDQLLAEQGVAAIAETGVPFNPAVHEAIEKVKDEKAKSGFVLEIVQTGYKLGDNVLKPARVKVSA
ncbi:MAG: nucleotide exchange factor GrpE, partial [Patescibacteria group bacterium]